MALISCQDAPLMPTEEQDIQRDHQLVCRPSQLPHPVSSDGIDTSVQGAADKDNWRIDYACTVKPSAITTITKYNLNKVKDKYSDLIPPADGFSHIHDNPPSAYPNTPYRELSGDIITSICQANMGKANFLFVDFLDVFICLANKDNSAIHKGL